MLPLRGQLSAAIFDQANCGAVFGVIQNFPQSTCGMIGGDGGG